MNYSHFFCAYKLLYFLTGSLDDVKTSEIEVEVVKMEQNQAAVNYGEHVGLETEGNLSLCEFFNWILSC